MSDLLINPYGFGGPDIQLFTVRKTNSVVVSPSVAGTVDSMTLSVPAVGWDRYIFISGDVEWRRDNGTEPISLEARLDAVAYSVIASYRNRRTANVDGNDAPHGHGFADVPFFVPADSAADVRIHHDPAQNTTDTTHKNRCLTIEAVPATMVTATGAFT